MHFLDLNDDVLRLICSYLYAYDALRLSLTCKRVHTQAIHCVASWIECDNPQRLRLLHRYMRKGPASQSPGRYTKVLKIWKEAFFPERHEEDDAFRSHRDADFSDASLLADVLENTRNLLSLDLPRLRPLRDHAPQITPALLSLDSLTCLQLDTIGDADITILQKASFSDLRELSLVFHNAHPGYGMPIPGEPVTFPPLLRLLATFSRLEILRMHFFAPSESHPTSLLGPALLPSIKSLYLLNVSHIGAELVQLLPNLIKLEISLDSFSHSLNADSIRQQWRPLRHLAIEGERELAYAQQILPPVHHLEISDFVSMTDVSAFFPGRVPHMQLLSTLQRTSPVVASLTFLPDNYSVPLGLLRGIATVSPRLRVLKLFIGPSYPFKDDFVTWLGKLPAALSGLQLVSLDVYLPNATNPRLNMQLATPGELQERKAFHDTAMTLGAEILLEQVLIANPNLRFLMVVAPSVTKESPEEAIEEDGDESEEEVAADDPFKEEIRWARHPTEGMQESIRRWRISHEGGVRRPELLTYEEAAWVERYLREADLDGIMKANEVLSNRRALFQSTSRHA